MQPATIRRLLVFGVCLVGVGCLYLVPSMAGSGQVGSSPLRHDLQTTSPTEATVGISTTTSVPATPAPLTQSPADPSSTTSSSSPIAEAAAPRESTRRARQSTDSAATAAAPGRDENPPARVGRLTVLSADPDRLAVSWDKPEGDDVVGYRVQVNGFFVLATQQTRATVAWFNDTDTHVVQVRAVDQEGNEGPSSPTLLVNRPEPEPEPTITATPSPSDSAVPSPSQVAEETPGTNDAAPSPTLSPEGSPKENDS